MEAFQVLSMLPSACLQVFERGLLKAETVYLGPLAFTVGQRFSILGSVHEGLLCAALLSRRRSIGRIYVNLRAGRTLTVYGGGLR